MTVHRWKSIRYLISHLKPYRMKMILSILFGIVKEASIILAAGTVGYTAAELFLKRDIKLCSVLLFLIVCVLLRGVSTYLESYLFHDVAYHTLVDYRIHLYDKFVTLCPQILLKNRSGQIATTLMNDIERFEWFYGHTVGTMVVVAVTCLSCFAVLLRLNGSLAWIYLLGLAVLMAIPSFKAGKADEQGLECRFRLGEANSVTLEGINGMNEILTLNWRERYRKKNASYMEALTDAQVRYARRMGIEGSLLRTASALAALVLNLVGISLVQSGQLSLEWYAAIGVASWVAFLPMVSLCGMARSFGEVFASSERVTSLMEMEPAIKDTGSVSDVENLAPEIAFSKVSFQYEEEGPKVLQEVSFAVHPGETVALVGESGAGKTTCTSLLNRLWNVKSGKIEIGGMDIRKLKLDSLRQLIAVVPQDVYLFNSSIRDNLRLGKKEATEEEIKEAAKMACIHDFIESLPYGYDTVVGERGVQMSGGQRQRIAIARALLKDAPILVMDEAVSNLDTKTDQEIQDTIRNLSHKKTILIVAHRLSTIREADRLVVLHRGEVVQEGTHEELIKKEGFYKNLIAAQIKSDPV